MTKNVTLSLSVVLWATFIGTRRESDLKIALRDFLRRALERRLCAAKSAAHSWERREGSGEVASLIAGNSRTQLPLGQMRTDTTAVCCGAPALKGFALCYFSPRL